MKRITLAGLALVVVIALAGCSARAASVIKTVTSTATEESLPMATQLVVGTFRLEDTDQAVDSEQAAVLIPLWRAYRGMNGNTSSSRVEVQALLKQIRGAMTDEQMQAIAAMQLTGQDMMELMREWGIEMTAGGSGAADAASVANRQAERPALGSAPGSGNRGGGAPIPSGGGGMPAGGDPGMGGLPGGMASGGTPSARQPQGGAASLTVPIPLYNAMIELLESKV